MAYFKESVLPVLLWIYVVLEGVRGGWQVSAMRIEPEDPLPAAFLAILAGLLFLMGLGFTLLNFKTRDAWIHRKLAQWLGAGSYAVICRRVPFHWVAVVFFALVTVAGLVRCHFGGFPLVNRQMILLMPAVSLGVFAGWVIVRLRTPSLPAGP